MVDEPQGPLKEGLPAMPSPIAREMIDGLTELRDVLRSGEPIGSRFRVTTVEVDEDGNVERSSMGPGANADA